MNEPRNDDTTIDSDTALVSLVSKAELDQSIATAHQWPRSITKFRREALEMATIDQTIAGECIYALPRREWDADKKEYVKKIISGPSVRLAEIIVHSWGNVRAGTRVVDEGTQFVTAQGVFHDLEKNVGITCEVKRRITNKDGKRFSADMIAVTANAGCSIALRNAIFKGIPKALWLGVEQEVRKVIAGDAKTLEARRGQVMGLLNKMGVTNDQIFAVLDVAGIADVGLDEIVELNGIGNAIREGEISIEEAFSTKELTVASRTEGAKEALRARQRPVDPVVAGQAPAQAATTSFNNPLITPAESKAIDAARIAELDAAEKAALKADLERKEKQPADIPWEKPADQAPPQPKTPSTDTEWANALKEAAKLGRKELDDVWGKCVDVHTAADREIHLDLEALLQMLIKRTKAAKA